LDSFEYAENMNMTVDFFVEFGRYTEEPQLHKVQLSQVYNVEEDNIFFRHTSHLRKGSFWETSLTDTILMLENINCGQYERIKSKENSQCPLKNLRLHYSDEREILIDVEYQKLRKIKISGQHLQEKITTFYELTKNEYLFLSEQWYIKYVMGLLMKNAKIFKQWEKTSSDYFFNTQMERIKEIIRLAYNTEICTNFIPFHKDNLYSLQQIQDNIYDVIKLNHDEKPFMFISSQHFNEFITIVYTALMDIYTLGRMFKVFDNEEHPRNVARNIIVYAGYYHTNLYKLFLSQSGFETIVESSEYDDKDRQCINMSKLPYPAFSDHETIVKSSEYDNKDRPYINMSELPYPVFSDQF